MSGSPISGSLPLNDRESNSDSLLPVDMIFSDNLKLKDLLEI